MLSLKNQYLREMGVDVWVLRQDPPASVAPSPDTAQATETLPRVSHPKSSPVKNPVVPDVPKVVADAPGKDVPEFHLCFVTYTRVSLVFSVPLTATSLPDRLRRFADDVAMALGERAEPRVTALQWPMVRASHIDQSGDDARIVVAQRIARCADRLALFGEAAATYAQGDKPAVLLDDIASFIEAPLRKRELWRTLRRLMGEDA